MWGVYMGVVSSYLDKITEEIEILKKGIIKDMIQEH